MIVLRPHHGMQSFGVMNVSVKKKAVRRKTLGIRASEMVHDNDHVDVGIGIAAAKSVGAKEKAKRGLAVSFRNRIEDELMAWRSDVRRHEESLGLMKIWHRRSGRCCGETALRSIEHDVRVVILS